MSYDATYPTDSHGAYESNVRADRTNSASFTIGSLVLTFSKYHGYGPDNPNTYTVVSGWWSDSRSACGIGYEAHVNTLNRADIYLGSLQWHTDYHHAWERYATSAPNYYEEHASTPKVYVTGGTSSSFAGPFLVNIEIATRGFGTTGSLAEP